jgi:hypothetical protein
MQKLLLRFIVMLAVSFYLFPFMFTILPTESLNSKNLMAGFGFLCFVFDSIRKRSMKLSEATLFAGLLAAIFSVWCLYSVTAANTYEMDYASYISSFIIWMSGAYGVYFLMNAVHGKADQETLICYLAAVGLFQCVTAVLIDNVGAVESLVDKIMYVPGDYYKEHQRMYGLGAALDPAGIRFSVILIMIAHLFSTNANVRSNSTYQALLLGSYAVILVIGAVISRTTVVGGAMGIVYIVISLFRMRKGGFVTIRMVQAFFWFFIVLAVIIGVTIYLYRSSETFYGYVRFGFEGFFSWVETGEFSTGSTDVLEQMWVWPDDLHTWIFGRGTYGVYENDSDIGYVNFTFYCGLIGMVLFSIYFLYCHLVQNRKFKEFFIASWMLVALTFIVWCKVTTDIFFIDALLFCMTGDYDDEQEETDASNILPSDIGVRNL